MSHEHTGCIFHKISSFPYKELRIVRLEDLLKEEREPCSGKLQGCVLSRETVLCAAISCVSPGTSKISRTVHRTPLVKDGSQRSTDISLLALGGAL